jgi:hypothetical protein
MKKFKINLKDPATQDYLIMGLITLFCVAMVWIMFSIPVEV